MRLFPAWLVLSMLLLTAVGAAEPSPTGSPPAPTAVPLSAPSPSSSPRAAGATPSPAFDLPPLEIPEWGENWWEEPFLFEVASSGKMTAEQRARRVLDRVHDVVDRVVADGGYPIPEAVVDQGSGMTVVRMGSDVMITVLPEDIPEYYLRLPPERLKLVERQVAERWAGVLDKELQTRVTLRTPQLRWLGLSIAAGALICAILINAFLTWFARRYMATPLWSLRALVWLVWLWVLLSVVPELDGLQRVLQTGVLGPLWLVLTASLGSAVILQLARGAVHRYLRSLARHRGVTARLEQRMASLEGAAFFALRLVIFVGAVFYVVTGLGIDASQMLAGAGLFGAALTLVAQDLIRDLIAGVNILIEDQFVVGDWIEADAVSGTVEAFHLRATRVRATDGTACMVPNSALRTVKNHSLEWSQVDYQVSVAMTADAERALEVLVEEATSLAAERTDQTLGAPEVLGVERLGPDGITLRLLVRTRPLQQWSVRRELNRRVRARFQAEGIDLAGRRQNLRIEGRSPEERA